MLKSLYHFYCKSNLPKTFLVIIYIIVIKLYNFKTIRKYKKYKLLALNPVRFRQDLEILNNTKDFEIIKFPSNWQFRLLSPWLKVYDTGHKGGVPLNKKQSNYLDAHNEQALKIKNELQFFLRQVFPKILKVLKIHCVISASVHYAQDIDLGEIAQEYGVPYVVINNENFSRLTSGNLIANYYKKIRPSKSNLILTANDNTTNLIKSTIGKNCKVKTIGFLRMDNFYKKIKQRNHLSVKGKKIITLFSFASFAGIKHLLVEKTGKIPQIIDDDHGWSNLFRSVHNQLLNFASNNDNITLYIKIKWGGDWKKKILLNWSKYTNGSIKFPKNCIITEKINPQELIYKSDLVVGFNSSTIVEACLKEIPIIVPNFCEANKQLKEYAYYSNYRNEFTIVDDEKNFINTISESLLNNKISLEQMNLRKKLFSNILSDINDSIVLKCTNNINEIIMGNRV